MKNFNYIVTDPVGLHARPAGVLAKKVKDYDSKVTIVKGEKNAEANKLMAVMALGIKQGDEIAVTIDGADESTAYEELVEFFNNNF